MAPTRLLILQVENPIPGLVKPTLVKEIGAPQATLIYRASLRTLIRQLSGLQDTNVWITYPKTNDEAPIRQWLTPLIHENPHWRSIPLTFLHHESPPQLLTQGLHDHVKVALIGTHCLELSSRWIHTAFSLLSSKNPQLTGYAKNKPTQPYLEAHHQSPKKSTSPTILFPTNRNPALLPELPIIETAADWKKALDSPLGPHLKKSHDLLSQ